jgi:viroplasmin and RNaseH domain-containing protein
MDPCYVVFKGKKSGIYMSWHECSEQVLVVKNAIHKKYNNYEHALRDFNASVGAATPSPQGGKTGSWKNVVIISLLVMVVGLWMRLSMSSQCNCNT